MKNILLAATVGCLVVFSSQASAHIRCGAHVVQPGETIPSLLAKCGRPSVIEDDLWIYDLPGKYIRIVRVRRGRVWSISKGREGATIG